MTKFRFRLEKVLDYRRTLEDTAKTAYMEARARRIDAEHDLQGIRQTRETALTRGLPCLEERRSLHNYISRLEGEEHDQKAIIGVLEDEEEQFRQSWLNAREEAEALQKLRDAEFAEWQLQASREEQAELDEWAVLRRAA